MSKFVALMTVAVSFALGASRPALAGQPHPLCCEFWRDAWEDPFGCKAACKAAPAPAAEPACPAPACTPKTEPVAPPTTPEAPPAPTTAQRTAGQRSYSYDPAPASQTGAPRSYLRPAARPVSLFRADRKLHGL
jgi:hypothetical protein